MPSASALFGFLNLNKPAGVSSRDIVNRVQKVVRPLRTGHAGTLDPLATGVLLVCVGDATRLVSRLQELPKTYVAEFLLGQSSDTDDSTGSIREQSVAGLVPDEASVLAGLRQFTGVISQIPPAFSAVHVSGRRAYDLARRGEVPELQPREVTVHSIQLLRYEWPVLRLKIECSSGTYIRSIARDLGKVLGCGGLMSCLERTAIGPFHVQDSLDPEGLTAATVERGLISPLRIVDGLPQYVCTADDIHSLRCGRQLVVVTQQLRPPQVLVPGSSVALVTEDPLQLCAVAEVSDSQLLQPRLVFLH
ncbi:MAG: tRNA pseudouridine(55) synthase TruB [Planctomycetaceae bacterium]